MNAIETFFGIGVVIGLGILFFVVFGSVRTGEHPTTQHNHIVKRQPEQIEARPNYDALARLDRQRERDNARIAAHNQRIGAGDGMFAPKQLPEVLNGEVVDEPPRYTGAYNVDQLPPRTEKLPSWKLQRDRRPPQLGSGR